MPKKSVKLRL